MAGFVRLLCSSFIAAAVVAVAYGQIQTIPNREVAPPGRTKNKDLSSVKLRGLCRDGWSRGKIRDFAGKEIPICLKINQEEQTWKEAKQTCRKDYGFLLKLDSSAYVDQTDLLLSVFAQGITEFWSGMHTQSGHLVWDDLIPNQVRPHNRPNASEIPQRPWHWDKNLLGDRNDYCGQIEIITEDDDKKRRRRRSPDDDSPDFDLSSLQAGLFQGSFRNPQQNALPRASAFQSMLSRTPMSDQLPDLPRTSLGIQSQHQIPGSGLSESNLQNGGFATGPPVFEAITPSDDGDSVSSFGNFENGGMLDLGNQDSSDFKPENPTQELYKNAMENIESMGENKDPHDVIKDHIQQQNDEGFLNANIGVPGSLSGLGDETKNGLLLPSTTSIPPGIISTTGSFRRGDLFESEIPTKSKDSDDSSYDEGKSNHIDKFLEKETENLLENIGISEAADAKKEMDADKTTEVYNDEQNSAVDKIEHLSNMAEGDFDINGKLADQENDNFKVFDFEDSKIDDLNSMNEKVLDTSDIGEMLENSNNMIDKLKDSITEDGDDMVDHIDALKNNDDHITEVDTPTVSDVEDNQEDIDMINDSEDINDAKYNENGNGESDKDGTPSHNKDITENIENFISSEGNGEYDKSELSEDIFEKEEEKTSDFEATQSDMTDEGIEMGVSKAEESENEGNHDLGDNIEGEDISTDFTEPSESLLDEEKSENEREMNTGFHEDSETLLDSIDETMKALGEKEDRNDPDIDLDEHENYEEKESSELVDTENEEVKSDDNQGEHEDTNISGSEDKVEETDEFENEVTQDIETYEDKEKFDDMPSLSEVMEEENKVSAISQNIRDKQMQLADCKKTLPSVCFSYEVEVMDKASTCDVGWYGHVMLDTCYKILDRKYSFTQAMSQCSQIGARLVFSNSKMERMFVLVAAQREGKRFRGGKFWMETNLGVSKCSYFDEKGVHVLSNCNRVMNVVCVKDAYSLSVYTQEANSPSLDATGLHSYDNANRVFSSRHTGNVLQCDVISNASEFPVLWFKDGVLVETKDTYISRDTSVGINSQLLGSISAVTDRKLEIPALQGQYWCEVWDRQTLTRRKSSAVNVRFSDVLTFHGSMEMSHVTHLQEVLFNMMNEEFPELMKLEQDLKKVFADLLPVLQTSEPAVTDVFTDIDKINSHPGMVEYHTYFTMSRDFSLEDENNIYTRIKNILRAKLGNSGYVASLPGGTSIGMFRTMSLQSTVSCPAATLQTDRDLFGQVIPVKVFSFPRVMLGNFANSLDNCSSTNPLPAATARCLGDFYTGAYWGEVTASECLEEAKIDSFNNEIWGSSPFTGKLSQIAQTTVDAGNVMDVADEMAKITDVAVTFTPTDINKIADVLDHTTQINKLPKKVGEAVMRTVDKLMAVSDREAHVANIETKAANRIIKSLERYADNADLAGSDNMRMVSDNVVVEIWNLKPDDRPIIGLAAESLAGDKPIKFKDSNIATIYNRSHLVDASVDAAIELPEEVFSLKEKGERLTSRLTMMVFRKSKLFEAAVSAEGKKIEPTDRQLAQLNSYVISASIAGKQIQGLTEKVKTIFKPIKETDGSRSCVWWDFNMHNLKGGWSSEGCYYDGRLNGRDICLCDHLTNFAVLLDFYGQAEPIPDHHELSLSIITILGLSCSIIGLSLTIISYAFFRKLRKGRAQQTLFNLSLALLLSMLVFLVGIKQTHSHVLCLVVAILLHYFILVSFMWMLMEAVLQYLTFVKILGTYITRFTMKTVLPAWGLPLIPVIAVLSIDHNLYRGGSEYCWMDMPAFYYAFVIPVSGIILINIVIFIITIVSIFRRGKGLRTNQKKQKMAMTNLQAAITSFVLLGLTWLFGYLAISDARLPFQYVFTILNSLQGFFIFVLFVIRKKKVREQWYIICCKGGERDRVSRSLSASNSLPSSYSGGSRNSRNGKKHERDRSDSTKTIQSTFSNTSSGFTNYGYENNFDYPYATAEKRAFKKF